MKLQHPSVSLGVLVLLAGLVAQDAAGAQEAQEKKPPVPPTASASPLAPAPPPGYVIGPEDVLEVLFWREKDMSAQVRVRPDGQITLPLLNEVKAAGLTPEELRKKIVEGARQFVEDPNVVVVIKEINSRKVFITGQVGKPGAYPLTAPTTVLQLISMAGGLQEYAKGKNIVIMRTEGNRQLAYRFNYQEVIERKKLRQNIELKPGDTVIVP